MQQDWKTFNDLIDRKFRKIPLKQLKTKVKKMYAIQVNTNFWLVGTRNGWLMLSQTCSDAKLYQTEGAAVESVNLCRQMNPENQYRIEKIFTVPHSTPNPSN